MVMTKRDIKQLSESKAPYLIKKICEVPISNAEMQNTIFRFNHFVFHYFFFKRIESFCVLKNQKRKTVKKIFIIYTQKQKMSNKSITFF